MINAALTRNRIDKVLAAVGGELWKFSYTRVTCSRISRISETRKEHVHATRTNGAGILLRQRRIHHRANKSQSHIHRSSSWRTMTRARVAIASGAKLSRDLVWRATTRKSAFAHLCAQVTAFAARPGTLSRQRGADILGSFWSSGRIYVPSTPARCPESGRPLISLSTFLFSLLKRRFCRLGCFHHSARASSQTRIYYGDGITIVASTILFPSADEEYEEYEKMSLEFETSVRLRLDKIVWLLCDAVRY